MTAYTIPPSSTSDNYGPNLITTEDGLTDYAVWYDDAGELHVGKRVRATQQWGVSHTEYTFAGAARTALGLPVALDGHNYAAIARDRLGYLHVWANMHLDTCRQVKSANPDDITAWADATTALPSVGARCTYPSPVQLPGGDFFFWMRTGRAYGGAGTPNDISGRANTQAWRNINGVWQPKVELFRGLTVPNAKGPGVDGDDSENETVYNWSSYPVTTHVEASWQPHPGRIHMAWVWRIDGNDARTNITPSYAYSDDGGVTWKAIDGSAVTLPIDPVNSLNVQCGVTHQGEGYINGGGLCLDPRTGYPVITVSSSPWYEIKWTGSAWTQTTIGTTELHGRTISNLLIPYAVGGHLWLLTNDNTPPVSRYGHRMMMLAKRDGTTHVKLGDRVRAGGPYGTWEARANPVAHRLFGTVEVLIPNGNSPRVYSFGGGRHAAIA